MHFRRPISIWMEVQSCCTSHKSRRGPLHPCGSSHAGGELWIGVHTDISAISPVSSLCTPFHPPLSKFLCYLKQFTTRVTHYTTSLGVTPPYKKRKALPLLYEIYFLLVFEWDGGNPDRTVIQHFLSSSFLPLGDLVGTTNIQTQMKWNWNAPSDTVQDRDLQVRKCSPWKMKTLKLPTCASPFRFLELTAPPPTCVKFHMATMKGKKSTNRESEITKPQNRKIH